MTEHNLTAGVEDANKRIDSFVSDNINNISRSYSQKLLLEGKILVNGKPVKQNYKLKFNDKIQVLVPEPKILDFEADESIQIEVLYEDSDIIVVNKPQGLVVHPAAGNYSGTLVNALLAHCGENLSQINGVIRPGIVHRIDKDTSGVLVVAKNNISHLSLAEQIKEHTINRRYIALVHGRVKNDSGTINAPIGRHPVERKKMAVLESGKNRHAVTYFTVIEHFEGYTLLECRLETGRTHQIRVHMAHIKHPIVGDPVYGPDINKFKLDGQALHAKLLGFIHPSKKVYMEFEAPLPKYFEELLNKIRK